MIWYLISLNYPFYACFSRRHLKITIIFIIINITKKSVINIFFILRYKRCDPDSVTSVQNVQMSGNLVWDSSEFFVLQQIFQLCFQSCLSLSLSVILSLHGYPHVIRTCPNFPFGTDPCSPTPLAPPHPRTCW